MRQQHRATSGPSPVLGATANTSSRTATAARRRRCSSPATAQCCTVRPRSRCFSSTRASSSDCAGACGWLRLRSIAARARASMERRASSSMRSADTRRRTASVRARTRRTSAALASSCARRAPSLACDRATELGSAAPASSVWNGSVSHARGAALAAGAWNGFSVRPSRRARASRTCARTASSSCRCGATSAWTHSAHTSADAGMRHCGHMLRVPAPPGDAARVDSAA